MSSSSRPYNLLARFYDRLQPDLQLMHRHARLRLLGRRLVRIGSVCDLGCGSGETALYFARSGARVFAVDTSGVNCRLTRAKARRQRLPVKVLRADMRSFWLPQQVDLVTCEFASLNHLPRQAEIHRVFRAVARVLRPGGVFLFDVNTCRSLAEQYEQTHWFEQGDFKLVLRGRYHKRRRKAFLDFAWFLRAGKHWRHVSEKVENICWSDAEIRRALSRAGFTRIRAYDGVDARPEPSRRVRPRMPAAQRGYDTYYLARRK